MAETSGEFTREGVAWVQAGHAADGMLRGRLGIQFLGPAGDGKARFRFIVTDNDPTRPPEEFTVLLKFPMADLPRGEAMLFGQPGTGVEVAIPVQIVEE